MTKAEKIARLQTALLSHRAAYRRGFADLVWAGRVIATGEQVRAQCARIIGDIRRQLERYGV